MSAKKLTIRNMPVVFKENHRKGQHQNDLLDVTISNINAIANNVDGLGLVAEGLVQNLEGLDAQLRKLSNSLDTIRLEVFHLAQENHNIAQNIELQK